MKQFNFLLFLLALPSLAYQAQDLHTSQPSLAAVFGNPATTGMFQGTLRASARYRAQWVTVPVNYRTFAAEADRPLLERNGTRLSAGIRLAHDVVGDGMLTYSRGGASISGIRKLSEKLRLGVGADFSLAQRAVTLTDLKFKNQWMGDVFDASAPNKEPLGPKTGVIPMVSAGLAMHFGKPENARTYLQCGVAAHQVNKPMVSFQDSKQSRVAPRLIAHIHGAKKLSATVDAVGFGQYQLQSSYRAALVGSGLRMVLGQDGGFLRAVQTTVALRAGDAIVPAFQVDWGPWNVGFSWDINTSGFQAATARQGAWELACVYRIVPAPPVPEFKVCPVF